MASQDLTLRKSEIYGWVCPDTGNIVYVGKTAARIPVRMISHRVKSRRKPKTPAEFWMQARLAEGKTVFALALDEGTIAESSQLERDWISYFGLENLLNVRVGGHGNPGETKVIWTAEFIALMGKLSDTEIARIVGCSRSGVSYRRRLLGISPAKQKPCPTTITLPLDILARLGTEPDYKLARALGVSKFVIAKERRRKGIVSFADDSGITGRIEIGEPHRRWKPLPPEAQEMLGLLPDYAVGKMVGLSSASIASRRRRLGIPAKKAQMGERAAHEGRSRKRRADAGLSRAAYRQCRISGQTGVPSGEEGQV